MSATLLSQMRSHGINLWEEGDRIGFQAPKGRLTTERKSAIHDNKKSLLESLRAELSEQDRRCDQLLAGYPGMGRRYRKEYWWPLCSIPGWRDTLRVLEKAFLDAYDRDGDCYREFEALRKHWQSGIKAVTAGKEGKSDE